MPFNCRSNVSNLYTGWFRPSNVMQWQWIRRGKPLFSDSECEDCLRQLGNQVIFIGDSHSRNTFFYLLSLLNLFTTNLTRYAIDYNIGSFSYTRACYVVTSTGEKHKPLRLRPSIRRYHIPDFHDAVVKWRSMFTNEASKHGVKRKIFFIVEIGSWDIAFRDAKFIVNIALKHFRPLISALHQVVNTTGLGKVFVLNIPSFPEWNLGEHYRNNILTAAVNELVADAVSDMKHVTLIDYYSMSYSRSDEAYDGVHYVYPLINSSNSFTMTGHVDIAIAKLLIELFCKV